MLELAGMTVTEMAMQEGDFRLSFTAAGLIKTMDNAQQKTRWQQSGRLIIRAAETVHMPKQALPCTLRGGDLNDNIYVYRDSVRLPLHSHGQVGIEFVVAGDNKKLIVCGQEIEIIMQGSARYVEHLHAKDHA